MKILFTIYGLGFIFWYAAFGQMPEAREHKWPFFKFVVTWPWQIVKALFPKQGD